MVSPQELVVEEQIGLVGALDLRIVDAVDREFPRTAVRAAVDGALNRDALTDLPAVLLRGVDADDGAGPIGEPGLLLILGQVELLGYMRSQLSGSTANVANWFLTSW